MDLYYVYLEWWAVLLLVFAFPFVAVPPIVRGVLRFQADPVMGPVDQHALPVDVARWFWDQTPGLEACGFGLATCFTVTEQTPNSHLFAAMWTNRRAGEVALVTVREVGGGHTLTARRTFRAVEFFTVFSNGVTVVTGNRSDLSIMDEVPARREIQVPDVQSPSVLHHLHADTVERFAPTDAARSVPTPGYELVWYRNLCALALREQEQAGWLVKEGDTTYKPAWRAAFLLTWGLLPPIRWIRAWRRREHGEKQLAVAREDPNRYSMVK